MRSDTSVPSEELPTVEDLAYGSSPTSITAPPSGDVPVSTAWRMASHARSSPGALPYHMPRTPSRVVSLNPLTSWLPITAAVASSSLSPGWWTSCRPAASARPATRPTSVSKVARGDPG